MFYIMFFFIMFYIMFYYHVPRHVNRCIRFLLCSLAGATRPSAVRRAQGWASRVTATAITVTPA